MKLSLGKVVRRGTLYFGLALGFLAICGLLVWLSAVTGVRMPPARWGEFTVLTPVIFWIVVMRLRKRWHHFRFWFTAGALLTIHVLAFIAVLINCPWWPPVWFIPVFMVEAPVLYLALERFGMHHIERR